MCVDIDVLDSCSFFAAFPVLFFFLAKMEGDEQLVLLLRQHSCDCLDKDGNNCTHSLNLSDLNDCWLAIKELETKERELLTKGYLLCATSVPRQFSVNNPLSPNNKKRKRDENANENEEEKGDSKGYIASKMPESAGEPSSSFLTLEKNNTEIG